MGVFSVNETEAMGAVVVLICIWESGITYAHALGLLFISKSGRLFP